MAVGETILKFTDYPFAYSFIGIVLGMIGFSLGRNDLVFLGIAGAFGTFLTIVDPLGGRLRKVAENRINAKQTDKSFTDVDIQFRISAIKSKSITYEIEKIVGMFYFVIIVMLFMIAVVAPTPFFEKLVIYDKNNQPLFDDWFLKLTYLGLSLASLIILAFKAGKFWNELDNKIVIAGYHLTVINDDDVTPTSVESMTRAIEQNDWELADLWSEKIEEEKTYKKGKREIIIKSADIIFSPLHVENINIETSINRFEPNRMYSELPKTEWDNITKKSYNFMIDDGKFRQRIHSFYIKIDEYNALFPTVVRNLSNVINSIMSSTYQKQLTEIMVNVRNADGSTGYRLVDCALFNVYPTTLQQGSEIQAISVQVIENGGGRHSEGLDEVEEIKKFEGAWQTITNNISSDEQLRKLKQLIHDIQIENRKLQEKYHEMIEWQWKV